MSQAEERRERAVAWLVDNPRAWRGRRVERYEPGRVSHAWKMVCRGLKLAGIYSWCTYDWDIRLGPLVKAAGATLADLDAYNALHVRLFGEPKKPGQGRVVRSSRDLAIGGTA